MTRGMRVVAVALLFGGGVLIDASQEQPALTLVQPSGAQERTFRAGVDLVQLDVVVLDQNRRPVTGLTAADFTILEDGTSRKVETFTAITLPTAPAPSVTDAAWTREVAPDVISNRRIDEGRVVVVVMDRSIPVGAPTLAAQTIARSAVDALGPNDLAAVVRTSGFSNEGQRQGFTNDRSSLRSAIDQPFTGLVAPPEMTFLGLERSAPNLFTTGDCLCGRCVFDTIIHVADALRDVQRQKVLLFVGSDLVIQVKPDDPPMCLDLVNRLRTTTFRSLDRANVTLHSIDPSGLETGARGADTLPTGHRVPVPVSERLERQGNLGVLPDYTGGRTVLDTNAPESLVPDIFAETQSYYLLGFQRATGGDPAARRNIRVRVNRDDVMVRSRTGYYVASPAEAIADREPGEAALAGVLPKSDVPLLLAATPQFKPDGTPETSVRVAIAQGSRDDYRMFDIVTTVLDDRGDPRGGEKKSVEVEPSLAAPGIVETESRLPLAPGRYEIRVGVADVINERSGSVYGYVTVEEAGVLAIGGITLASGATIGSALPTLRRAFASSESVTAGAQIVTRVPGAVTIQSRVVDVSNRVVHEAVQPVDHFNASGVADVVVPVPLARLAAGRYLLTMDVRQRDEVRSRALTFDVSPSVGQ